MLCARSLGMQNTELESTQKLPNTHGHGERSEQISLLSEPPRSFPFCVSATPTRHIKLATLNNRDLLHGSVCVPTGAVCRCTHKFNYMWAQEKFYMHRISTLTLGRSLARLLAFASHCSAAALAGRRWLCATAHWPTATRTHKSAACYRACDRLKMFWKVHRALSI